MNLESQFALVIDLFSKSSAILLAAFGIAWLARKTSAARRHYIWVVALIALALLPVARTVPPRWSWFWQKPFPADSSIRSALPIVMQDLPGLPMEDAPERKTNGWHLIVFESWRAGVLLLGVRQVGGWGQLRELRRRSSPAMDGPIADMAAEYGSAETRVSPQCAVPLTWGWLRPVVLLPASASCWPAAQLRAALAHECGHIARRDFLWRQLAKMVRAFYWPNPLVWAAVRALHRTEESACDDLVLLRGASPKEYATQLLDAARSLARGPGVSSRARHRDGAAGHARKPRPRHRGRAARSSCSGQFVPQFRGGRDRGRIRSEHARPSENTPARNARHSLDRPGCEVHRGARSRNQLETSAHFWSG